MADETIKITPFVKCKKCADKQPCNGNCKCKKKKD